ncbi:hypothetical protein D0T25_06985 [Duganella sp. BJB488]|uniref:hypothetical protein n=1 Tax=unclassified Duganella TaxID=2636909 RepID=UPI000E356566|nr:MULTISPECIES: hypothetical protein [unclassified Duganella]RFP23127.1 hypothetical protein D0T26_08865 [Duganella sp. BJB489]RFP24798.1 hypothetical protein D0T25_06985 [Duganella sp. BJB488]RFP34125.1 hypothetical protein D0T24_17245 [Duganella sp. BJB480]
MNEEPKISINKLGEYMTATPARRRQIVRDQKNPPVFKAARYRAAREAIVGYIESGMVDDGAPLARAAELRADTSGTDFTVQDRQLSAEAIEDFLPLAEELEVADVSVQSGYAFASETVDFGGTKVSMRPDAILKNKETGDVVGCVKLNFSKSAPILEQAGAYVATALRAHLEANAKDPKSVDPALCYIVDVPTGTVSSAPTANKRRLSDLAAAGEEIAARWKSV